MNRQPLISVIIPVYNNAEFLGDAIGSVLQQTYSNFELIIVNDASPDNAADVIRSFDDSRIKYVEHEINQGLSAARNTGIRTATGEYIALLDGDDFFHPDKLKAHVEFLTVHPEIDVTYNPRFELNHSSTTIRELWRPPLTVDLSDLVLGYPFSPSDMVVKRECLLKVDLFDVSHTYYGEDMDINCKLALAGYKFASVDRVLNYRRFHSRRIIKNLSRYKDDELRPLDRTFADPRCPSNVLDNKDDAYASRYLGWSIFAFLQNDTELGQQYCLEAIKLNPSLLDGRPPALMKELIRFCIMDENRDHEELIRSVIKQLPDQLGWPDDAGDWATARGYLLKGIRALVWGRKEDGENHIAQAISRGAKMEKPIFTQTAFDLINYEETFGTEAVLAVIEKLTPQINLIENPTDIKWTKGFYFLNRAYKCFDAGEHSKSRSWAVKTIFQEPGYLKKRDVLKFFLSSFFHVSSSVAG